MLEEAGKSWLARIQTLHDEMMTWEEVLVEVARGRTSELAGSGGCNSKY